MTTAYTWILASASETDKTIRQATGITVHCEFGVSAAKDNPTAINNAY